MASCCSNKHCVFCLLFGLVLSVLNSLSLSFFAYLLIFAMCVHSRAFVGLRVLQTQPQSCLQSLRVIYTVLFSSLQASHQSELSTPPLHLSLATFYLAQQVA